MPALLAQGMGGDGGMGVPIVMVAAMILFAVLLIAAAVWLVRWLTRERDDASGSAAGTDPDAEEILARRLAAGEIELDEYHRRRNALPGRDGI